MNHSAAPAAAVHRVTAHRMWLLTGRVLAGNRRPRFGGHTPEQLRADATYLRALYATPHVWIMTRRMTLSHDLLNGPHARIEAQAAIDAGTAPAALGHVLTTRAPAQILVPEHLGLGLSASGVIIPVKAGQ